ncbi:MAG TPA: hypothetical protein VD971_09720 [Phycisphaerales bacterium]|nr:hypothetical protein [Phycisphaerales bacterium]
MMPADDRFFSFSYIPHRDHEEFLFAQREQRKLMLSFFSKGGRDHELRLCAPIAFEPLRRSRDQSFRYHFFDFTGEPNPHPMALSPDQIFRMKATSDHFNPMQFARYYPDRAETAPDEFDPRH